MAKVGQVWASGERTVQVLATRGPYVVVRDTFGWRRSMTAHDLEHGFARVVADREPVLPGVMARRSLADVEPG